MTAADQRVRFEHTILPHLDAAYNLARWLVRNPSDAEDLVQEAMLRAVRFFDGYRGGDARSWLLAIVRRCCFTWLSRNRAADLAEEFDELTHSTALPPSPESLSVAGDEAARLRRALDEIPAVFREAVVLRELEEMSYKEIAEVAGVSIGTVMSRIARGRERLRAVLARPAEIGRRSAEQGVA
ncbi:MAG: sigma-70 family RNA polymerase sigma factor [Candidatus Acidiferrales bacterium]